MSINNEQRKLQKTNTKIEQSNLTGLILCGGAARRVGGDDKGLLKAGGKMEPLIEHQLAFLRPQVSALAISANRNLAIYRSYGFPVYQDMTNLGEKETKFDGPLQGILKGLKSCQTDWLYIQPIDTPNLPFNAIDQFLEAIKNSDAKTFYLISDERPHYLHLLLHTSCYASLKSFVNRGERRAKTYLEEVRAEAVNLGWRESVFKNLNDIGDYQVVPRRESKSS